MNTSLLWRSFYGEQLPLAYLLREHFSDRWFRIHSLPDSKRYAEDENETREILHRHNVVAGEVLGEGAECVWFVPDYALQKFSNTFNTFSGDIFYGHEDKWTRIVLLAGLTVWRNQKFDSVLRLVADDVVHCVCWMNVQSGEIFAPYDGGADLFLSSSERRDELRSRHQAWLSHHPQGL